MRRGFTLVEMVVVVTIGVAIFAAALMIFNFSNRSRSVTATARALQTALLIQERFCEDMGRLVPAAGSPVGFDKKRPSRLSFWCVDPTHKGDRVGIRGVKYSLKDDEPGLLMREWDGREEAVGAAPLESIAFAPFVSPTGTLVRVTMRVGREKGEPPGPATAHSFLARIPAPTFHKSLKVKLLSGFLDEKDDPDKDELEGP